MAPGDWSRPRGSRGPSGPGKAGPRARWLWPQQACGPGGAEIGWRPALVMALAAQVPGVAAGRRRGSARLWAPPPAPPRVSGPGEKAGRWAPWPPAPRGERESGYRPPRPQAAARLRFLLRSLGRARPSRRSLCRGVGLGVGLGRGAAPRSRGSEPVPVLLGGSQARGQLCPLAASSPGPGDPCPHWGPGAAVLTAALLSVGPLCAPSSPSQGGAEGPSG